MRLRTVAKWLTLACTVLLAAPVVAAEPPVLKTEQEIVNYAIGVEVVRTFRQQGIEIDLETVIRGMTDALSGEQLLMPEGALRRTLNAYRTELRHKEKLARQTAAVDSLRAGEAFLAENRQREGVVTLSSGLQYRILKTGDGRMPTADDVVECHYRGAFVDGTEFDNTYDAEEPVSFKVSEGMGIAGWSEAVPLMPVGSRWQLFLPSRLAFGEQGGGRIGPNTTLVFEMELLAIR